MPSRSWTWKIWGADLLSPDLQRMETMPKEEKCHRSILHKNSWQIFEGSAVLSTTRRTRMGRSEVWRNGQIGTRISLLQADEVRTFAIFIELEHSAKRFRTKQTDGHSSRLSICSCIEKSPPRKIGRISKINPTTRSRPKWKKTISSQNHTAKKLESTRKLGGDSGHLLRPGGRLINRTWKEYQFAGEGYGAVTLFFVNLLKVVISFTVNEIHCNRPGV